MIDKKSIVTVLVVLIIMTSLASVIIVSELNGSKDKNSSGAYQVIGRVNSEGSGIYINDQILRDRGGPEAFYSVDAEGTITFSEKNQPAWNKLILGTPGAATIQHVFMQQIVESMDMTFTMYKDGEALKDKTVYYVSAMSDAFTILANDKIQAGIIWEPQFSITIGHSEGKYKSLALTNDIYPGHTCCILAGSMKYMRGHVDVTERFLYAYMESVKYIQKALKEGGEEYDRLLATAMALFPKDPDHPERTVTEEEIETALRNIEYAYADDGEGDLSELNRDICELTDSLESMGLVTNKMSDLGFAYTEQFANAFVDGTYIKSTAGKTQEDFSKSRASITVACISGDIHQIAIHMAKELGFFEDLNLNVTVTFAKNGPGVAVALQNNSAQFGFLGAPPATSTVINGKLITA